MYHVSQLELDQVAVRECHRLQLRRSILAVVLTWVLIAILVFFASHFVPTQIFWWFYVPIAFLIAGRQGALLQLVHEGSHRLLAPSKAVNDRIGKWLCALPVGVNYEGYASGHVMHHAHTGTDLDPPADTEKYRNVDVGDWRLYALFLKDLVGITALSVFLSYITSGRPKNNESGSPFSGVVKLAQLILVQGVLLAVLFQFNVVNYVLLWLVPAACFHMLLMRIRGIAEHGLNKQLSLHLESPEEGNFYTRSFGTPKNRYRLFPLVWVERALIGSLNVYYHHEHHLFPKVPFYNLPKLHSLVADQVSDRNPDVYAAGYFSAFSRGLGSRPPMSEPSHISPAVHAVD